MQITCKGCHIVLLQGTTVQSGDPNNMIQSLPCDAELYIFQDQHFLTLQMLDYQNILRKKKRIFSAKGLEVNISVGNGQFQQNSDCDQNNFLKRIILKFNEAQSRIEQFSNFYQYSIKLADLKNEILNLEQKNKTNEKIIEDLKKEMFRKTSRGLNSSEFHSCRDRDDTIDHSNILIELEQQFIKGQMKWAQIDMENATLNQQVQELTTQLNQLKKQVNHQGTNLLQSRQILGDILNLALEKGDHSILIKAGL